MNKIYSPDIAKKIALDARRALKVVRRTWKINPKSKVIESKKHYDRKRVKDETRIYVDTENVSWQ